MKIFKGSYIYNYSIILFMLLISESLISGTMDISGSNISTTDAYLSGESSQNLSFDIVLQTSDNEYFDYVSMTFINGFTINYADNIDGIGYTISNGSKTIKWIDSNWYITPGTYSVNINMDVSNDVTGTNNISYTIQGDESGTGTHYISSSFPIQEGFPDLIITNMLVTPMNQYEDDYVQVTITIKNQGNAPTQYMEFVSIFYDLDNMPTTSDDEDDYTTFDPLNPGEEYEVTISNINFLDFNEYSYGTHNIHAYVDWWHLDPNGQVEESDENNNAYGPIQVGWIEQPTPDYYPWPIDPDNAPHEISSVVNEYRPTGVNPEHTHKGIDIPKPQGQPVYSVSSGKVRARNTSGDDAFIRLKGNSSSDAFEYYHIQNQNYGLNEWIYEVGIQIAEVGYYPQGNHLHFNDWTMYGDPVAGGIYYATNSIRTGGLDYTQDYSNPLIKSDYLRVQPNESNEAMNQENVHGMVDFIIAAKDISAIGNRIGLAKIRFTIGGLIYQVVILDGDMVFNNDVIPYLFCKHCGGGQPYSPDGYVYYYTTNNITHPAGDFQDHFDTDLLPDGNYELCITVEDCAGYTDEVCFNITINNSASMEDLR